MRREEGPRPLVTSEFSIVATDLCSSNLTLLAPTARVAHRSVDSVFNFQLLLFLY